MPLPPLTADQRTAALRKAAEARRTRAAVRDRLKHSGGSLAEVLAAAARDEAVGKMRVAAVLEAMPGVGKVRATQIMQHIGIAPSRRIRGLGAHQRDALVRQFSPAGQLSADGGRR